MIFPISRAVAIKQLFEDELNDLHKREMKCGYTLPFFNVKSLFYRALKNVVLPTTGWTDTETDDFNRRIHDCMPRPEIFGLESPTMSSLEFVHEWDNNIFHNMETIEIMSKDKKKHNLMD